MMVTPAIDIGQMTAQTLWGAIETQVTLGVMVQRIAKGSNTTPKARIAHGITSASASLPCDC